MTDEKLIELARLVLEQTNFNNLTWEETAAKDTFQATLSKYVIRVNSRSSIYEQAGTDYILTLVNQDGTIVESFDDVELTKLIKHYPLPTDLTGYAIMEEIFKNAKRHALGVDKALDDVLKELKRLPPF